MMDEGIALHCDSQWWDEAINMESVSRVQFNKYEFIYN